jgi:hypothetical protein
MKRYNVPAPDGKVERISEPMFDHVVAAALARLTRDGHWVVHFEVARAIYARPNARTFENVASSLYRSSSLDPMRVQRSEHKLVTRYRFVR